MTTLEPVSAAPAAAVPLVVDLDGTLVLSDTLLESILRLAGARPAWLALLPLWLLRGKAYFKQRLAGVAALDPASLPYNQELLALLRSERELGRPIWLASGQDSAVVAAIASGVGLFTGTLGSDGSVNLTGKRKLAALTARFPAGFDYAGNSGDDLPVWRGARRAIVVTATKSVSLRARRLGNVERELGPKSGGWRLLLRALRPHQWSKNLLLFLPLLGAHRFADLTALRRTALAFVAFGLVASSVYVANDLLDLESDRRHARKRSRPFASGLLSLGQGAALAPALLLCGAALSLLLPAAFRVTIAAYWVTTLAYSLALKRRAVLDVFVLAGLYTVRIYAGSSASGIVVSQWLATFSIFFFVSLAFVKRCSELVAAGSAAEVTPGRGYRAADRAAIFGMGISSGFVSALVLALYFNSQDVLRLYSRPERLWFLPVLTLYWLSKLWLAAGRGEVDDDPIVYAARSHTSFAVAALGFLVMWSGI